MASDLQDPSFHEVMRGSGAVISDCGRYRYRLWRIWDEARAPVAFVMLNPSTADATSDDPTLRRCMGFARDWGAGGVVLVNVFAYRATKPTDLVAASRKALPSHVKGPDRDDHLRRVFAVVDHVVCAWGSHPIAKAYAREIMRLVPEGLEVSCLGLTKDGAPKHPLYLASITPRIPFRL
ncbi:MAG: DUF1643 domain-containing protein [Myxococcales bacterium]|nr:DUF1643 domain-containing protein [Myxococcales bacterium]